MSKYRYVIRSSDPLPTRDTANFQESLNKLGNRGYRVVGFTSTTEAGHAIYTAILERVVEDD